MNEHQQIAQRYLHQELLDEKTVHAVTKRNLETATQNADYWEGRASRLAKTGGEPDELLAVLRKLKEWVAESESNAQVAPLERLVGYIAARLEAYE